MSTTSPATSNWSPTSSSTTRSSKRDGWALQQPVTGPSRCTTSLTTRLSRPYSTISSPLSATSSIPFIHRSREVKSGCGLVPGARSCTQCISATLRTSKARMSLRSAAGQAELISPNWSLDSQTRYVDLRTFRMLHANDQYCVVVSVIQFIRHTKAAV
jgi:hypothetical protein